MASLQVVGGRVSMTAVMVVVPLIFCGLRRDPVGFGQCVQVPFFCRRSVYHQSVLSRSLLEQRLHIAVSFLAVFSLFVTHPDFFSRRPVGGQQSKFGATSVE